MYKEIKFEGLVNLTSEENELLKEYIDQKIDAALAEIRQEIDDLKSAKVTRDEAVTHTDIRNLFSMVKDRR